MHDNGVEIQNLVRHTMVFQKPETYFVPTESQAWPSFRYSWVIITQEIYFFQPRVLR